MEKKKIVFLTGSGISQPSGLATFRTNNGLWNNHNVMDIATPAGFAKNPTMVHDFYNDLRKQINTAEPNFAHTLIAEMQEDFDISVITQNIDNLHERAGSENVIHLHGTHDHMLCKKCQTVFFHNTKWTFGTDSCPTCQETLNVRPYIVWFEEQLDTQIFYKAEDLIREADLFVQVGTSAQVFPAAKLLKRAKRRKRIEMNLVRSNPRNPWLFHNYYIGNVIKTMPEFIKDIPVLLELREKGLNRIL